MILKRSWSSLVRRVRRVGVPLREWFMASKLTITLQRILLNCAWTFHSTRGIPLLNVFPLFAVPPLSEPP